jgi:hypothetical protein
MPPEGILAETVVPKHQSPREARVTDGVVRTIHNHEVCTGWKRYHAIELTGKLNV